MTSIFRNAWEGIVSPLLRRPPRLQVAALCYQGEGDARKVLLITSSRGRWILPKGWPIDGLDAKGAALQEAWEEAGVKSGKASPQPIGCYQTVKRFDAGHEAPCEIEVFAVEVQEMAEEYPDAEKRERRWVSAKDAAGLVEDEGLAELLLNF